MTAHHPYLSTALSACACGVAAGALALAIGPQVFTQGSKPPIYGCGAPGAVLRMTDAKVPCAPGERRVLLKPGRMEQKDCEADDRRLAGLERRLRDLEYRARQGTRRGRQALAPFEVVTKGGQRLLYIEEENVAFYNMAGSVVARVQADASGGALIARTAAGDGLIGVGALGSTAQVWVQEKQQDRLMLGLRSNSHYGLAVYGRNPGTLITGIGQSQIGSGLAFVADTEGVHKVRLTAADGGRVTVLNPAGSEVAFLDNRADGTGRMQLVNGDGTPIVAAGVNDGVGLVQAGPAMRQPGVGIVGLVPSFIKGRK